MKGVKIYDGYWRDSARPLRMFIFSAWIGLPILAFMLHIRWWTFGVLVATIVLLRVIEHFGFTIPVAALAVRATLAGRLVKRRYSMFGKYLDR